MAPRTVITHPRLDFLRLVRGLLGPHRTCHSLGGRAFMYINALSTISSKQKLEIAHGRGGALRTRRDVSVALAKLRTVSQVHSCTQRIWSRTVHRQQRILRALGKQQLASKPQRRRAIGIRTRRRDRLHGPQTPASQKLYPATPCVVS